MEFVIIVGAILIAWIIVWLIVGIIAGTVTSVQESMKKTGGAGFFGFLRFLSSLAIAAASIFLYFLIGATPKIFGMARSTAISIAVFFGFVGCILFFFFPAPPRIAEGPTTLRIWGRLLWMLFLAISGAALYIAAQNRDIVFLKFAFFFEIVGIINFISFPLSRDYRVEEDMPAGEDYGGYDHRTWQQQFVNAIYLLSAVATILGFIWQIGIGDILLGTSR